jgi:hypothetical protein
LRRQDLSVEALARRVFESERRFNSVERGSATEAAAGEFPSDRGIEERIAGARVFRGAEKVLLQRAKILAVLLRYFFASPPGDLAGFRRLISLYARVVVFCTGDCGTELIDLP